MKRLHNDEGSATAEYAIATMAAVGFAGLLATHATHAFGHRLRSAPFACTNGVSWCAGQALGLGSRGFGAGTQRA